MTFEILFVLLSGFCCVIAAGYGLLRLGYICGFEAGRKVGHDSAARMLDRANASVLRSLSEQSRA